MAFCSNCGYSLANDARFCTSCGKEVKYPQGEGQNRNTYGAPPSGKNADFFKKLADTPDSTHEHDAADIQNNKVYGILSYIGVLVLVSWFAAPNSRFARYHARQGMTLFVLEVGYWIISALLGLIKTPHYYLGRMFIATPGPISFLIFLLSVPLLVLSILGIVNAAQGKAKALPIIGSINFFKNL